MSTSSVDIADAVVARRATSKAGRRILPLLFVCYVIAYVDRANVGYAALTLSRDLPAIDSRVLGLGSGLFFLGYFLLEVPGSLIVERWSARKWLARIMVTWGVVAASTAFVKTPNQFYAVRFLLGLAEAGFFPGVIVYLTHWFPTQMRARAMSMFLIATPVAQLLTPKLCNLLLPFGTTDVVNGVTVQHPPLLGLHGWQWVFIAWGLPAVVLGVVVLLYLPDRPGQAKWLSEGERDALEADLARDLAAHPAAGRHVSLSAVLRHPPTLLLALVLFSIAASNYALDTFLPTMLRDWYHLSNDAVTTWLLLPPFCALVGLLLVGWSSDRTGDRRYHTAACVLLAALGLAFAPLTNGLLPLTLVCVSAYAVGNKGSQPPFWAIPSLMLTGPAAAASTGLINSLGNLGGFLGPYLLGSLQARTGSFLPGLYVLAGLLVVCAVIPVLLRGRSNKP